MLVGGVAPIVAQIFDRPFLPSRSWFELTGTFAYGLAALCFLVAWPLLFVKRAGEAGGRRGSGLVGRFLVSTFGAAMLAWAAGATIVATCPMALALAAGKKVVLRYEVDDATRSRAGRRCGSPVILRNMPMGLSAVCNVPENIRRHLRTGMQVELEGWGTSNGLFHAKILVD